MGNGSLVDPPGYGYSDPFGDRLSDAGILAVIQLEVSARDILGNALDLGIERVAASGNLFLSAAGGAKNGKMKTHRFYTTEPLGEQVVLRDPEMIKQIVRVLKLTPGEQIGLFTGDGHEWIGTIEKIGKEEVRVKKISYSPSQREASRRIELFCAVLKRERFEWVVEKATEIGVAEIHPLLTARTIKQGLNLERLGKIAREAAEQSGRATIPKIFPPVEFTAAVEQAQGIKLLCDESGQEVAPEGKEPVALFIGPEGGWTPEELAKARELGVAIMSLGTTVLRGETAAIVASHRVLL